MPNIIGWDQANQYAPGNANAAQGRLNTEVQQLAPLATTYHVQQPTQPVNYVQPYAPHPGALPTALHFFGAIGSEVGHIAGAATSWLAKNTANLVTAPVKFVDSTYHFGVDAFHSYEQGKQIDELNGRVDNLNHQRKAGQITNDQYKSGLNDIISSQNQLQKQIDQTGQKMKVEGGQVQSSGIDTAATLITLATVGVGSPEVSAGEKLASVFLKSPEAEPALMKGASAIGKIATSPEIFSELSPATQAIMQRATAEILANQAIRLPASEIAKSVAMNMALKYPVNFWWLSGTGHQIYQELDQAKYGDAVRTLAFNAALVLSGGPIGYALKQSGKLVKGISSATFGQTSFWDELSKFYGKGELDGFYKAINKYADSLGKEVKPNVPEALKGQTVYRAGKPLAQENVTERGISVTPSKKIAQNKFSAFWNKGPVNTHILSSDAKIMPHSEIPKDLYKQSPSGEINPVGEGNGDYQKIIAYAKSKGYDGVDLKRFGEGEIRVFNPKHLVTQPTQGAKPVSGAVAQMTREEFYKNLSAVEHTNINATGGDVMAAVTRLAKGMRENYGFDLSSVSHEEAVHDMVNFAKWQRTASETAKAHGLGEVTVGRLDGRDLHSIAKELTKVDGVENRLKNWESFKAANPNQAWANNINFDTQVTALIKQHESDLSQSINKIKAATTIKGYPQGELDKMAQGGYVPIKPSNLEAPFREGTGKLPTEFAKDDPFFVKTAQPLPILGSVGATLTSLGLSPMASTQRVYQVFNSNLAENLSKLKVSQTVAENLNAQTAEKVAKSVKAPKAETSGFSKDELKFMEKQGITPELMAKSNLAGEANPVLKEAVKDAPETITKTPEDAADYMIKKLSNYAKKPTAPGLYKNLPITDLRQLTNKDIQTALNITKSDAQEIKDALVQSMIQVPLDVRGLGDRAVDISYPMLRRYLRIQGAGRFSWNPFFQAKLVTKTEVLTQAEGGGLLRSIFTNEYKDLNSTRSLLREQGIFDERARLGQVVSGEAADNAGAASANLTHKLLPLQEKSISGLIAVQAERMNMDVPQYVKTFPEQVKDTVQMISQYDRKSNFLNSPLTRTLNVAIFPFRFESKVAIIMARNLAKSSMMTQVAVVKGLMGAHTWLNSTEGRSWYQQNAEAIGLFKYFVPIATLSEMFNALGMHPGSIGDLGELGGLPFGWIPQLLDSEGLTQFHQPGVNAKTGEIYTQYIPDTAKGQVATAVQDMLLSLFSYPGATAGLPSKTSIGRSVAFGITGATKNDFQKVRPDMSQLSPESQAYAQQIQMISGPLQAPAPTNTPTPKTSVIPLPSPLTIPKLKASKARSRAKKKSDYRPALLPGQTTLGQL